MKKYNISVPKKYEKNGEEKTYWANVGKLVKFDATSEKPEGFIIELNMFPETKFMVFEDKPKEQKEVGTKATEYPVEEENPDNIPF